MRLHQSHDKLFFQSLRNRRVAQDALRAYLPKELLEETDLENIQLYKTKLISPQYKKFEADIIYEIPVKNKPGLCLFHCEHQSTVDRELPLRLWQYLLLILMEYSENHRGGELPIIYPVILYTGEAEYSESTDFFDLFGDQKAFAKQYMLKSVKLLDVCRMSDDEIKKHTLFGLSEFAFKYKNTYHFRNFLLEALPWMRKVESDTGPQYIDSLMNYIFSSFLHGDKQQYEKVVNEYESNQGEESKMTIADEYRQEGWEKGMQQGIDQGSKTAKEDVAKNLLKENVDERLIAKVAELTPEKIYQLKQELIKA